MADVPDFENEAPSTTFAPRLYQDRGYWHYDDGFVHGEVEIPGENEIVITDWFSPHRGQGNTVRALNWLRAEGYTTIRVEQVIEGARDYWLKMQGRGLVNQLTAEGGGEVAMAQTALRRFEVPLVARGVQVTAASLSQAEAYAREDARECADSWVWELDDDGEVCDAAELDLTSEEEARLLLSFSVENVGAPEDGDEGLYTFDLHINPVVEATDTDDALHRALKLYGMHPETANPAERKLSSPTM